MEVQKKNRIRFVEPTANDERGYVSPLEDYCMYVNLKVEYVSRYSCGMADAKGMRNIAEYSSSNGTISFMDGTNGYLTTNFTDVSTTKPWQNTNECLGIRTIDISYSPEMFPHVRIVFVDVRGSSLMTAEEYKTAYGKGSGSFYGMLYSVPPPVFILTVKGFYGRGVQYRLAVNNISQTFNAQTGDFEITVDFMGYMFGAYADIPMTYIAISPYIKDFGSTYWLNQTGEGGRFMFKDGDSYHPMIKFSELRRSVSLIPESEDFKNASNAFGTTLQELNGSVTMLKMLMNLYPFKDWLISGNYLLYPSTNSENLRQKISNACKNFYDHLKSYRDTYGEALEPLSFVQNFDNPETIKCFTFKRYDNGFVGEEDFSPYDTLFDRVTYESGIGVSVNSYRVYLVKLDSVVNGVDLMREKISLLNKEIENIKKKSISVKRKIVSEALGFPPTIRNIYNLAFAHFETFVETVYNVLAMISSEIDSNDDTRNINHYGLTSEHTDCTDTKHLPPFSAFYFDRVRDDGVTVREQVWPGDLDNGSDLYEVKFVESVINAIRQYNVDAVIDEQDNGDGVEVSEVSETSSVFDSSDFKLSIYMTLKRLYDKWFCASEKERWILYPDSMSPSSESDYAKSEFSNFLYIDNFYHDIGDKLLIDVQQLSEVVSTSIPTGSGINGGGFSVYNFLSLMAQKNGGNLVAYPVAFGGRSDDAMQDMFSALPANAAVFEDSPSFIFLYTYELSKYLDNQQDYTNDGFMITGSDGRISDTLPECLCDDEESERYIGCFGVSYARQNQCFFKDIRLTTESPTNTEASLAGLMNIAQMAGSGPRESAVYGQNIYRAYTTYSYACSVDMLGNAQILPLMYFQLNGVPMWRGVYMIQSVHHSISQGQFDTTFTGYRVNRNSLPLAGSELCPISDVEWNSREVFSYGTSIYDDFVITSGTSIERSYAVWNHVFNELNLGIKSYCTAYVGQMAAGYCGKDVIYGVSNPNHTRSGASARDANYHKCLKSLGYTLSHDKIYDIPSSEMKDKVEALDYTNGDVVVYYATEHDYEVDPSAYKYGHTQFFVGKGVGWTSSMKYNYATSAPGVSFVYGKMSKCKKWRLMHFKAPSFG